MALCDSCRQPGHCCSGFVLDNPRGVITHWDSDTREQINADILWRAGWPFKAIAVQGSWTDEASGLGYSAWYFGCPVLGADGRCTDYENRPQLCRDYRAGSTPLCVEHVPGAAPLPLEFKGIQIIAV